MANSTRPTTALRNTPIFMKTRKYLMWHPNKLFKTICRMSRGTSHPKSTRAPDKNSPCCHSKIGSLPQKLRIRSHNSCLPYKRKTKTTRALHRSRSSEEGGPPFARVLIFLKLNESMNEKMRGKILSVIMYVCFSNELKKVQTVFPWQRVKLVPAAAERSWSHLKKVVKLWAQD